MRRLFFKTMMAAMVAVALMPASIFAQACSPPLGYGCSLASIALSAYTGYFGHRRGADITFSASDQPDGSVQRLRQQFDLQGISTEIIVPIRGKGAIGLALGFGLDACFAATSEETIERAATTPLTRTWRAEPLGGNVHANLTLDLHPSLLGLVGFRYENFQTNFFSPSSSFVANSPQDSAALAFSAYIPTLGLVYRVAPSIPGVNVQFGAVGFPFLLGNVDYKESGFGGISLGGRSVLGFRGSNTITRGAFLDAFGDVSVNTMSGVQIGAYIKYELMRAGCNILIGQGAPPPGAPENPIFQIPHVTYGFDFQRQMWGAGGRVAISF